MYDCIMDTLKFPKRTLCISIIQEITSIFIRVRDKYFMECDNTKIRKQKYKYTCSYYYDILCFIKCPHVTPYVNNFEGDASRDVGLVRGRFLGIGTTM